VARGRPGNLETRSLVFERLERSWRCPEVEPMTGIEPAYSAWEADVLPLNYIGDVASEG
jgi:hypothetical protein